MTVSANRRVVPVVLCGGAGTRLWPMSREEFPKQLLPLAGESSLLQDTLLHFTDPALFLPPLVVTNQNLRFAVAEQMRQVGITGSVVLEPVARNTAPAIATAALILADTDPDALMLVVPSDHIIRDEALFVTMVMAAAGAAAAGHAVTFSIVPTRAETGYGYIHRGAPLPGHAGLFAVSEFVEKPDAIRAGAFVASGEYFWNSGMFLFAAKSVIAELGQFAPEVLEAARQAIKDRIVDLDFIRLGAESFAAAPSISIDYALMEKTPNAATIPCAVGWTDVGSWGELWSIGEKDADANVLLGDVLAEDCHGCYVRAEKDLVAVVGVENLVVVATDDAILVTTRERCQDVKLLVERLRRLKRPEVATHSKVYRPWGSYQSIDLGERFQVKRLIINAGTRISLQKHFHRAEHWVVVSGTALVTREDEVQLVRENESIYIPSGAVHRLENPGKIPLHVIEVQSGSYLGEDDIVRLEDVYGRV